MAGWYPHNKKLSSRTSAARSGIQPLFQKIPCHPERSEGSFFTKQQILQSLSLLQDDKDRSWPDGTS